MDIDTAMNGMPDESVGYTVTTNTKSGPHDIKQNGSHNVNLLKTSVVSNGHSIMTKEGKTIEQTITTKSETKEIFLEKRTVLVAPPDIQKDERVEPLQETNTVMQPLEVASKYLDGPDQIIPSENLSTTLPDGCINLRIGDKGVASDEPISVPGLLHRTAQKYPDVPALATKNNDGTWKNITFKEYEASVRTCAKAFLKLGLRRYHSVCILGFNSPQWFISDLAAIYAGGFAAGIYTTNSAEACFHCAESSKANIIVVEDKKQLEKILQFKDQLPNLKAIVQYEGKPEVEGILSWDDLMKMGSAETDDKLEEVLKMIAVNECCTLVYTSGTVGNPKAVMLSHDNLTWTANCVASELNLNYGSEVIVSYLPLSHVAAQVLDIYVAMTFAATIYFADRDALKGSLVQTLQEARPTHFLGVPRVWEKISEKMIHIGSQAGGVKKAIASWAKSQGLQHNMDKINGVHSSSLSYMVANMLIFRRIKRALGFDRCRNFFTAAAPLSVEVKKYFMSLDIPVMEVFGMSESSGPHTISFDTDFKLESIGKTLTGLRTVIHKPDENGEGEICMGGRNVFMGYLNDDERTEEAIDDQGLLHSGDIGKVDADEFVYITGRIKELIITAGGENIPPILIEHVVKNELPCISHAMLIGDKRKFLSMLITLKTEVNLDTGEPLDELSPATKAWCKNIGSCARTVSDVLNGPDEKIMAAIQQGIDNTNLQAISNAQKIQKFTILPRDFSIPTGELGPTMKVKRNVVSAKYADIIERFYQL